MKKGKIKVNAADELVDPTEAETNAAALVPQNQILDWIHDALNGEELRAYALSFGLVRLAKETFDTANRNAQ